MDGWIEGGRRREKGLMEVERERDGGERRKWVSKAKIGIRSMGGKKDEDGILRETGRGDR